MKNFFACVSQVLAFNPKFESFSVRDERGQTGEDIIYSVINREEIYEDIELVSIWNGSSIGDPL